MANWDTSDAKTRKTMQCSSQMLNRDGGQGSDKTPSEEVLLRKKMEEIATAQFGRC